MGEAVDYAASIGASDFIDDVYVVNNGSYFAISTRSGITDFSRDRKAMLPDLLRNAKTSKDGNRYKVIPIRDKPSKVVTSSADFAKQQQQALDAARNAIRQNGGRRVRPNDAIDQFRSGLKKTNSKNTVQDSTTGVPDFKTASSKQNPSEKWVIPEKDMDMTVFLLELNSRLARSIEESVTMIIDSYIGEFS